MSTLPLLSPREAGFDWHLVKPINTTFLSELIAKLEPMRAAQSGT